MADLRIGITISVHRVIASVSGSHHLRRRSPRRLRKKWAARLGPAIYRGIVASALGQALKLGGRG